jgi:hypothetical protein
MATRPIRPGRTTPPRGMRRWFRTVQKRCGTYPKPAAGGFISETRFRRFPGLPQGGSRVESTSFCTCRTAACLDRRSGAGALPGALQERRACSAPPIAALSDSSTGGSPPSLACRAFPFIVPGPCTGRLLSTVSAVACRLAPRSCIRVQPAWLGATAFHAVLPMSRGGCRWPSITTEATTARSERFRWGSGAVQCAPRGSSALAARVVSTGIHDRVVWALARQRRGRPHHERSTGQQQRATIGRLDSQKPRSRSSPRSGLRLTSRS